MHLFAARSPFTEERELLPQSSTELMAGAEHALTDTPRLGAWYVHRNLDTAVEDMSTDEGVSYFVGNPGRGRGASFPEPVRTYDAGTVYVSRAFTDGWMAQASYTLSRLHGNYSGLLRPDTAQLQPNTLPDFDDPVMMINSTGPLPLDRTHSLKLFGAKEFHLSPKVSTNLGVSYRGSSGTPISYLGQHPDTGQEVFILPRGLAGRTPWVHTIDSNLGVNYRLDGHQVVSLSVAVFNLFNFQAVTRVDEDYTLGAFLPIEGGTPEDLPSGSSEENVNFRTPIQRQPPRQLRIGIRYGF